MKPILKPSAEWDTSLHSSEFTHAANTLARYYVLSTAVILLLSSVTVWVLFTPPTTGGEVSVFDVDVAVEPAHSEFSVYELREHLGEVLLIANVIVLLLSSGLAYVAARRTLRPIETVYRLQTQFVGDVAHELRTPLSVMKAGSETMLRKERSVATYKKFIDDNTQEIDRLIRLANQLLQRLAAEAPLHNKMSVYTANVSEVVARLVEQVRPYVAAKKITIHVAVSNVPAVRISSDALVQLLQNVLKNAIDYNKEGGMVWLRVWAEQTGVVFEVCDTGVGIASTAIPNIFDRFYKSDESRTSGGSSGAGLGLSIVQKLVEQVGGVVYVESTLGKGTTVTVTLQQYQPVS